MLDYIFQNTGRRTTVDTMKRMSIEEYEALLQGALECFNGNPANCSCQASQHGYQDFLQARLPFEEYVRVSILLTRWRRGNGIPNNEAQTLDITIEELRDFKRYPCIGGQAVLDVLTMLYGPKLKIGNTPAGT